MKALFPPLSIPPAQLAISKKGEQLLVWCVIRKKHLVMTPEEWVRQHVVHFLLNDQKIALPRINTEHLLKINGQNRRCDVLVVDGFGKPILIVECKAATVALDEKTLLQISNYAQATNVPYLWMTNGIDHYIIDTKNPSELLESFPSLK
ncbi:MAG: type I restriction enzyme HsdR N-terminal domain-containing protein [Fluviicola sp.]|nr:type I restriction enzyme HsdR N-terminal domain-containing protein [Fluviicola sp.]MBP6272350.1 type I restriction enzyme HsdR N-terminal domain-containing protein [Fluviicola sp.]